MNFWILDRQSGEARIVIVNGRKTWGRKNLEIVITWFWVFHGDGRSESHSVDMWTRIDDNYIFVLVDDLEKSLCVLFCPELLNTLETIKSWEDMHREYDFFASLFIGLECFI